MRYLRLTLTLAFTLLLAACGGQSAAVPMSAPMATVAPMAPGAAGGADMERQEGAPLEEAPAGSGSTSSQIPPSQRLVIKNASVSIQVEDVPGAEARIRARAEELGGYVVSVQTMGSDAYMSSLVTFRVPADRFEDALSGVEGLARKVLSRSVSGDDVTEEFVDLESRLRNLEATRDRLLDLLAKATRVEDALQVNQALTDVQGEIEQIQGRMKYLQQSAAFSTISADLQPVPAPPTIIEPDGWQPLLVAREALAGLVGFAQGLASIAIALLVWTPVWLPILLLVRWGVRRIRPRKPQPKGGDAGA